MSYNGLNQRLSMDAAGVIAHYVMDEVELLTAESSGNTTYYLNGRGVIGEKTTEWNYSLADGTNTPRQLADVSGNITLSARYTPWGNTLELNGTGNFTFGYLGSILDASTGLLYVGNGQYYDPTTGRFLTRGVNPDNSNPYVPWNPLGALIGPLALFSLVARRKKGISNPYLLLLLMLVVLPLSVGMACGITVTPTPIEEPAQVEQPPVVETQGSTTTPESGPSAPGAPTGTLTPCEGCGSTPTPEPKNWLPSEFRITHYTVALETDPLFSGSYLATIPISSSPGGPVDYYTHQHNNAFVYGIPAPGTTSGYNYGVLQEGTGYTVNGEYITIDHNQETNNPTTNDYGRTVFTYTTGGTCGTYLEKERTVATSIENINADLDLGCGDQYYIEGYGDTIFTITDSGSDVGNMQFDIFVGPMNKADFDLSYPETDPYHRVARVRP